jgi:prepilin signal peptidase PulO-like enzyme (type II secretory pathway)
MVVVIFLFGILLGILVNGLADNLPEAMDSFKPGDALPRCGYCGATRKWSDVSSLAGMLIRGGACARCAAPRSLRDILVEAVAAVVLSGLWIDGLHAAPDFLIASLILAAFFLMAVIDFEHRSVFPGILVWFSILLIGLTAAKGISGIPWILLGGSAGLGILFLCYLMGWVLAKVFRLGDGIEPLGFGDVWLGGAVGMVTGWPGILPAVFLAILLAGVYGIGVLVIHSIRRKPARNVTIAYGPFLLLSGLLFHFSAARMTAGIIGLLH